MMTSGQIARNRRPATSNYNKSAMNEDYREVDESF